MARLGDPVILGILVHSAHAPAPVSGDFRLLSDDQPVLMAQQVLSGKRYYFRDWPSFVR